MDRLRLLGMEGILPGFQGNVPMAMHELFPDANTSGGWLDATGRLRHSLSLSLEVSPMLVLWKCLYPLTHNHSLALSRGKSVAGAYSSLNHPLND